MIEPAVSRLRTYCEQQQVTHAGDDDQRNAYNFVERHINVMQPRPADLHAWLVAQAVDCRSLAFSIQQHGSPTMLADTYETWAAVYEELAARLQRKKKKRICDDV